MGDRVEIEHASDADALAAAEAAEQSWRDAQAAIEAKRLELVEVQRSEREARLAAKLAFERASEVAAAALAAAEEERAQREQAVDRQARAVREAKALLSRRAEQADLLQAAAIETREAAAAAHAELEANAGDSIEVELREVEAQLGERREALEDATEALERKREQATAASRSAKQAADAAAEENASLERARREVDAMDAGIEELRAAIVQAQAQVDAGEAAKVEAQKEVDAEQATHSAALAASEQARAQAIEDSQAVGRASSPEAMQAAAQRVMTSAQAQAAAQQALAAAESDLEDAKGSLSLADKAHRVAAEELAKANSVLAARRAEQEHARADVARLEQEAVKSKESDAANAVSRAASEMRDLAAATLKTLERELLELSTRVDDLRRERARRTESTAALSAAAEAAEAEAVRAEAAAVDAAEEVTEAVARVANAELGLAAAQAEHESAAVLAEQRSAMITRQQDATSELESAPEPAEAEVKLAKEEAETERIASESRDSWDLGSWGEEAEKELGPPFRVRCATPEQFLSDHEFRQDVVSIGRDETCDIVLDNPMISRRHAEIRRSQGLFALVDLGSPNGTFLNGKQASGLTILNDGDGIGLGKFRLTFSAQTEVAMAIQSTEAVETSAELGDLTLRMSPGESRRAVGEFGRVRGFLEVPQPDRNPVKVFISETFQVGKDPSCDLVVRSWFAPRKAAVIARGFDRYLVINVGPNAKLVLVNDQPIGDRAVLKNGDALTVCGYTLRYRQEDVSA